MEPREENENPGGRPAAEFVETLHSMGKLPDKFYYQLNAKPFYENYIDQKAALAADVDDYDHIEITSKVVIRNAK